MFTISLLPQISYGMAAENDTQLLQEANSFFHQANEKQDPEESKKLYEKALLRYQKLSRDGSNGKLFYNIGNTYFKLGDIGRAIVSYRRAEQLIPADENLQQNLNYVLSKRQDAIQKEQKEKLLQTLFFLHYDLSHETREILFSTVFITFWAAAGLMYFSPIPVPRWLSGSLLALTLLFATSLLVDQFQKEKPSGVIVSQEIMARQGDGNNYKPSFTAPLHAGTEFTLIENRTSWLQVELQDGRRCWLPAKSCELI